MLRNDMHPEWAACVSTVAQALADCRSTWTQLSATGFALVQCLVNIMLELEIVYAGDGDEVREGDLEATALAKEREAWAVLAELVTGTGMAGDG